MPLIAKTSSICPGGGKAFFCLNFHQCWDCMTNVAHFRPKCFGEKKKKVEVRPRDGHVVEHGCILSGSVSQKRLEHVVFWPEKLAIYDIYLKRLGLSVQLSFMLFTDRRLCSMLNPGRPGLRFLAETFYRYICLEIPSTGSCKMWHICFSRFPMEKVWILLKDMKVACHWWKRFIS